MVVNYANGNPLALKVLGSLLCSKNQEEWKSILKKLKKVPNTEILHVLRLSFEELDREERHIFLDIACTLKGETKWDVINLLDGCGYSTSIGLRSLQNKSLTTIFENNVQMHDLIEEMGWEIVRDESSKELEKRSRLWDPEEIYHVLRCKRVMDYSVESILLNMADIKDVEIGPKTFSRMPKLKILKFYLDHYDKRYNVHIPKGLESLPNELRCLHWDGFPLKCLPSSFCPEMLVRLSLQGSVTERLWEGEQDLANLKYLCLNRCKHLIELPNLSKATNLEEIHLANCVKLLDVPSSTLSLDSLMALDLSNCIELQCIRSDKHSKSLRWLNLNGCSRLAEFSFTLDKLEYLSLDGTALKLPFLVGSARNLSFLSLAGFEKPENIPNNFYKIGLDTYVKISNSPKLRKLPPIFETSSSITSLCLDGCSDLAELPDNLGLLSALNALSLRGSSIETLPSSIRLLCHLRSLNVSHCKRLRFLPELPLLLQELDASGCVSLENVLGSRVTPHIQESFDCQDGILFERQIQEEKISLPYRYYSQRFEFYGCRSLNSNALITIMDEAEYRMEYAAYISSVQQVSAESDPYNQFHQFSKHTDAQSFEYVCRRLCTSCDRHKFPSWFWLQRVESSTVTVKLNGNCCSHCRDHPYAFGIYLSNEEENIDVGFDGRHRICMQQWDEAPLWSYWKLGCNDVRLSLPARWFGHGSTESTCITLNLSPGSNIVGFVFRVVVINCLPNAKLCLQNVKCECYLETEGRRPQSYRSAYSHDSEMELISDTIFAWYDAYTCNRILEAIKENRGNDQCTTYSPKISFQFSVTQQGLNHQIKECAVSPIYATNLKRIGTEEKRIETEEERFEESLKGLTGLKELVEKRLEKRIGKKEERIEELVERLKELAELVELKESIKRRLEKFEEPVEKRPGHKEFIKSLEKRLQESRKRLAKLVKERIEAEKERLKESLKRLREFVEERLEERIQTEEVRIEKFIKWLAEFQELEESIEERLGKFKESIGKTLEELEKYLEVLWTEEVWVRMEEERLEYLLGGLEKLRESVKKRL